MTTCDCKLCKKEGLVQALAPRLANFTQTRAIRWIRVINVRFFVALGKVGSTSSFRVSQIVGLGPKLTFSALR